MKKKKSHKFSHQKAKELYKTVLFFFLILISVKIIFGNCKIDNLFVISLINLKNMYLTQTVAFWRGKICFRDLNYFIKAIWI